MAVKNITQDVANQDVFVEELQQKLLAKSEMVSSTPGAIDVAIGGAITGLRTAQEKETQRIESQFGREIGFAAGQFGQVRTAELEARRGFATNVAALRNLDERTEKSLKDMEQRKQELILMGEIATARQISGLQVQALQFKQQAEQQAFTNLFNIGQLSLQARAQDIAKQQFTQTLDLQKAQLQFTQDASVANIATQFGLTIDPNETLSSIVTKAQPFASAEQKARLAKLQKDSQEQQGTLEIDVLMAELISDGVSPGLAAIQAAGFARQAGFKVDPQGLMRKATEFKNVYQTELERIQEEQKGDFAELLRSLIDPKAIITGGIGIISPFRRILEGDAGKDVKGAEEQAFEFALSNFIGEEI